MISYSNQQMDVWSIQYLCCVLRVCDERRLQRLCFADQLVCAVAHHCTCANTLGLLPLQLKVTTQFHLGLLDCASVNSQLL